MNWIERMYELKGKDLYSQNGEGLYLEYIFSSVDCTCYGRSMYDVGGGNGFYLSNSRHLKNIGFKIQVYDRENGYNIDADNCCQHTSWYPAIISMDIDGNDYWILEKQIPFYNPAIIVAEFNPAFTDSRAISYNPDHLWAGDDYYGFSFAAGCKLAERFGYKVIFQTGNMNMFMVRADLIGDLNIPPVTFEQSNFFKQSNRTDWVII